MNPFISTLTTNDAKTANGMVTNSSTDSKRVDLFGVIGSLRNQTPEEVVRLFIAAFGENPLDAMRILFYARDIRGGQGERKTFRIILKYLAQNHPDVVRKNLHLISEYGRWDDILLLINSPVHTEVIAIIKNQLEADLKELN